MKEQNTDDLEMAKLAVEFLRRVDLKGNEVPAFMAVQHWLLAKAEAMPAMPPQPADDPMPHKEEEPS